MEGIEIITTSDGSHSLLNTHLSETYHSVHGAIQESDHVFIRQGLIFFLEHNPGTKVSVLEIGFGTGLNALLALQSTLSHELLIQYTSLESNPLDLGIALQLNYPARLNFEGAHSLFQKIHEASWTHEERISDKFTLVKKLISLQEADLGTSAFDVVFYDAFAPSRQPEMWEYAMLEKVVQSMKPGSVFVTYCAQGQLKRSLKSLGLLVETLPGPPGKKEMVRALKHS